MGYDMHFVQRGDDDYFRLNMYGMSVFYDYMAARGMVFDAGEHPEFPKGDWELLDQLRYPEFYTDYPPLTDEQRAAAEALDRANREVLAWHGPEIPGIPAHKFSTNDGWIVTPAECEAALAAAARHPEPEGEDGEDWRKWISYLDRARSRGGFEVH